MGLREQGTANEEPQCPLPVLRSPTGNQGIVHTPFAGVLENPVPWSLFAVHEFFTTKDTKSSKVF